MVSKPRSTKGSISDQLRALLGSDLKLSRHEDITADAAAALSAKRYLVRLSIGHHRLDMFEDGVCHYRLNQGKARIPSGVNRAKVALSEDRATRKLGSLGSFPFSTGTTVLLAPGGHGKTPLLWQFADAFQKAGHKVRRIQFGETRGEYMTDYADLLAEMMSALAAGENVFLDSLKNAVYDLPGGLAGGGVATALWPTLSDLSSVFDRFGLCLVALVNPSSDDVKVVANAVQALKSNTNGILTSATKGVWSGYIRDFSTGDRHVIDFSATKEAFAYDGHSVNVGNSESGGIDTDELGGTNPAVIRFDSVVAAALQKMIN